MTQRPALSWWQTGIIYHIYPRSFQDAGGDGVGDLCGIESRLDYLQALGIRAIWLSPIYPSPMCDGGYDVQDYCNISPVFGTLKDFDSLIRAAHAKGIRVLLDFVPNHTSDKHPWFVESRKSRNSAKRDWYIWKDPAPDGGPPNNWLARFGGNAWTKDETTAQYYFHAFLPAQPDLNWRNAEVRAAMHGVLRFWLQRGVDGFRVDAVHHLWKHEQYPDNPPNDEYREGEPPHRRLIDRYNTDQPGVHEIVAGLRKTADEFPEGLILGEVNLPLHKLPSYYGRNGEGLHLPSNFSLIYLPWKADVISKAVQQYEEILPPFAWPNWVLSNHDKPRIVDRAGAGQAKAAAALLLTLRGTPTIYYGDELALGSFSMPGTRPDDPYGINVPGMSRDPSRTPMQWDSSPNAGFTTGKPWLPVSPDYKERNVERAAADPDSLFNFYRKLIRLRQASAALLEGRFEAISVEGECFSYLRESDGERVFIALNLGNKPGTVATRRSKVLLSTERELENQELGQHIRLAPGGVVISRVPPDEAKLAGG